ncbi:hypothetical protein QJS10_CPB18g01389 [Acorus calamus]|uniref:starch synthase n=1 Tax=Acorus calamus TaxID=4465 RepID=A0AAV9CPA1_ACOCL|nr:hypothetical protein QJS10_CPB18g01389 [Acorus calamus]
MASVGTLSFFAESAATAEASLLLLGKTDARRKKLGFSAVRGGGALDHGVNISKTGSRRLFAGELWVSFSLNGLRRRCGCDRGRVSRQFGVRSSVDGDREGEEAEEEVISGDAAEDALQEVIEKSKKVLARQKDLLRQIVEGKEVVSSIKRGSINDEQEVGSLSGNDDSFSSLNVASSGKVLEDKFSSRKVAASFAHPTAVDTSVDLSSEAVGDVKSKASSRGITRDLETEGITPYADVDILHSPRESSLQTAQSKIMPSLLPKINESSDLTDDRLGSLTKINLESASDDADPGAANGEPNFAATEENENPPPLAGANVMNIILVAMECAPWSKTGGLGDVAGALPKALARRGHRVMVVVPRYGIYPEAKDLGLYKRYKIAGQDMEVNYFHASIDGVDFVFMESPDFRHRGNNIYGGGRVDVLKRMVLFCKAAVEIPWIVPCGGVCYGDGNLVFIANDWHTALLPVYLKAYYRDNGLMKYTRSVLVIHNIAHQGRGPLEDFSIVDLPDHYLDLFKLYDPVGGEHFNIFAAGLKTTDRVVTVSHGYAWEIKTSEGGWGLHEIINDNDWKLQGIVNGIDMTDWNPEVDIHLKSDGYTNFSLDNFQTKKPQCKAALQRELGLPIRNDVPMIGFIGRLDHQKGVDLIAEAIPWIVSQDVQMVLLGTGRADLEEMLKKFDSEYHTKVRSWVGFSDKWPTG